jgi:hypothetical protein
MKYSYYIASSICSQLSWRHVSAYVSMVCTNRTYKFHFIYPCLILEWMDTDLWHVPPKQFRNNSKLPKVICRSVLSALAIFRKHGKVNLPHRCCGGGYRAGPF